MAYTYMFSQQPELRVPITKKLTTDEDLDLDDFRWADMHAESRRDGRDVHALLHGKPS